MAINLIFNESTKYKPGIVSELLSICYADILDEDLKKQFRRFDGDVYKNPDTIGACTFITTLGPDIVGMASYDPRQAPKIGTIGHNCILPEYRRKGYGSKQIIEIVRRLKSIPVERITVSTSEDPFFEPARKMYISCGFGETEIKKKHPHDPYKMVYYEMKITR
jgi:GNAT superfamily N-acetyltransferase